MVRTELLGPESHALAGAEHDVHEPRRAPLDAGDLLRVEAELEDVVRLRVPGKLRVDDLVPAVGLELEKVRAPGPAGGVVEDGLVDEVRGWLFCASSGVLRGLRVCAGVAVGGEADAGAP